MSDEPPNSQPRSPSGIFGRHFSSRPEGSPYPKAELLPRLLARLTDFILAAIFPVTLGAPGGILAVLYVLFADGMFHGQSPGKKLLGIKVVLLPTGQGAGYRESALRNFPFAVALLLNLVPDLGGILLLSVGVAIASFEGAQAWGDGLGLRLGDHLAATQVVDTKIVSEAPARPGLHVVRSGSTQARATAAQVLLEPSRGGPPGP